MLSTHIADTLLSFSVIMYAAVLDTVSVMLLQSSNFEEISLVKGSPRPQPHGDDAFNHYSRAGNQSLPTSWRGWNQLLPTSWRGWNQSLPTSWRGWNQSLPTSWRGWNQSLPTSWRVTTHALTGVKSVPQKGHLGGGENSPGSTVNSNSISDDWEHPPEKTWNLPSTCSSWRLVHRPETRKWRECEKALVEKKKKKKKKRGKRKALHCLNEVRRAPYVSTESTREMIKWSNSEGAKQNVIPTYWVGQKPDHAWTHTGLFWSGRYTEPADFDDCHNCGQVDKWTKHPLTIVRREVSFRPEQESYKHKEYPLQESLFSRQIGRKLIFNAK